MSLGQTTGTLSTLDLISRRRDGVEHTREELGLLARGAADGSIPDYQLAAWLMAAYLRPLSEQETAWLTLAMAESGERVDLAGLPRPWVDKHSTGGVGDKTTLVLLPVLAACGLTVVKMSGRGLGITGGTIDKLESVPGFRVDLSPEEMKGQAARIGLALTGQTPTLAPADKALYALRDATATVSSTPLIVSSILSKKLAGGAEVVVIDVKCGSGAFMTTLDQARELAAWLVRIGELAGLRMRAAISDMEQPLGSAAGNALEVLEAIQVLRGGRLEAPVARFGELCERYAGLALWAAGLAGSEEAGRARAREALESGNALRKAEEWFVAQGGRLEEGALRLAPQQRTLESPSDGWVSRVSALEIGQAVVELGGGRKKKSDAIDHGVGIRVHAIVGDRVERGQPLLTVFGREGEDLGGRLAWLWGRGLEVSDRPVEARPLFLG